MSQPQKDKKFDNLLVAVILVPGQLCTYLWRASTESAPTPSTPSDSLMGHLRLPGANLYPLRTSCADADTLTTGIFTKQPHTGTLLPVSVISRPQPHDPQPSHSQRVSAQPQHQQQHQQEQQERQEQREAVKPLLREADAPGVHVVAFRDRKGGSWVRRLVFDAQDRLVEVGVTLCHNRVRCAV